jgi:hypothetical protein
MRKLAVLGLLLAPVLSASAQSQGTELSLRVASLGVTSTKGFGGSSSTSTTTIDVGNGGGGLLGLSSGGGASFAFYLSSGMAIEPSVSFISVSSDGESTTVTSLGLALPIYFDKTWGHSGLYVAPGVGLRAVKESGVPSQSQYAIGGELGTKVKLSEPVSIRLGISLANWFEKKDQFASEFNVAALFGISVFFKK